MKLPHRRQFLQLAVGRVPDLAFFSWQPAAVVNNDTPSYRFPNARRDLYEAGDPSERAAVSEDPLIDSRPRMSASALPGHKPLSPYVRSWRKLT